MPIRILLIVLAATLIVPRAWAEEVRFEGTAFAVPPGWDANTTPRPGLWAAKRSFADGGRGRQGNGLIQIIRPIPASEGAFDAVFTRFTAIIPELAKERPTVKGEGVTAGGQRIRYDVRCCGRRNGVSLASETVGISDGKRHAILMLVKLGLRGDADRAARAEFDALVRSFRLDGGDAPAGLTVPAGSGGLDGAYTHLQTGLTPNVFGGLDFRADNEVRVFDPSGLFSDAIPNEGSVAAHCQAKPADCGTYRLVGGGFLHGANRIELRQMTSRYGLIEVEEKPFARKGEDVEIGGGAYRRLPPLPRGKAFDGTWRYFFASAGSTAAGSGSVAVERLLTLTPDGHFRRSGFSGASSTTELGGSRTGFTAGGQRPAESGRYEAEGYQLVLIGDDGKREAFSLFLPDIDSDKLLVLNGSNYLKQGGK